MEAVYSGAVDHSWLILILAVAFLVWVLAKMWREVLDLSHLEQGAAEGEDGGLVEPLSFRLRMDAFLLYQRSPQDPDTRRDVRILAEVDPELRDWLDSTDRVEQELRRKRGEMP